jgi:hypothetical protein
VQQTLFDEAFQRATVSSPPRGRGIASGFKAARSLRRCAAQKACFRGECLLLAMAGIPIFSLGAADPLLIDPVNQYAQD